MKAFVKAISAVMAITVTISSMTLTASANVVNNTKQSLLKFKQERSLDGFSDMLSSFEKDGEIIYPNEYGGIYFDREIGKTIICLTDLEYKTDYTDYFSKSLVDCKLVEYNLDELNEVYYFISDNMSEKNVTTVAVSEKNNELEVSVENDSDKDTLEDFLELNGYDTDMITFIDNSDPIELDIAPVNDNSYNTNSNSTVNYAYAGSKLILNNNSGFYGTVGANAYNPTTNQYGIITAGHVARANGVNSFSNSSNIMLNNNTGVISLFSGNCDAAFIPFNSTNTFMNTSILKNGSISSCIYNKQPIVSPYMAGIDIVKYGATTGKQTGTLINTSISAHYSDGTVLEDLLQYQMERAGGDSGAPIGIEYSNSNDGLHLLGTHSGGSSDTCYGIKYRNIENELGVIITSATY